MIPGDIVYLKPESAEEAVAAWTLAAEAASGAASAAGEPSAAGAAGPRYLAGGTEILTTARRSAAYAVGALVDVKGVPEARASGGLPASLAGAAWLGGAEAAGDATASGAATAAGEPGAADGFYFGAALPLAELEDGRLFPLLSDAARGVADRTTRNRLSLGGNVAGQLPYREAVLPLLAAGALGYSALPADASAAAGSEARLVRWDLRARFDKRLALLPGELLLGFSVPKAAAEARAAYVRRTRTGPIDYSLITLCALRTRGGAAWALGGAFPYPARSDEADRALSEALAASGEARTRALGRAAAALGEPRSDPRASGEYRAALIALALETAAEELS